ncbi:formate dehydrogenase accessory sulfurtransferase FdhD [Methanolobus halotolerans]|uniref:Sulfur carrier protein FdhD n=1 Tax=Methanolobus halotolerans TaxID=2052935 RepID=A0A4E0PU74_9EURY|nr:formate dehydrogenase accessory sulfurtransferase FdhD [Methanolobus halotolerans]TGC08333.1 formate dehydrogenase family accessory protein FdhD [Methanolobus halotolerans]
MSEKRYSERNRKTEVFRKDEENISSPFYAPMECLEITGNNKQHINVDVILEKRFDLFVNNVHVTTFFASPKELEELALGFLVCEGFIEPHTKIDSVSIEDRSISCEIEINTPELEELTHLERCGTTSYRKDVVKHIDSGTYFTTDAIIRAVGQLKEVGRVWHRTGGTHTSIVCNDQGKVLCFCEDVGRACSVDKAVGKALLNKTNLSRCALVTTGRLASTMVSKAVNAGFPLVASKGATVREAVELAREAGITLAAFVRERNLYVYSGEEQII